MLHNRLRRHTARPGITLIELVIVLAILGMLVALLLPVVQMAREAARKMQCENNLKQIGTALASYESTHGMFPPGSSQGFSFHVMILPFVEQSNLLYDQIDFDTPIDINTSVLPIRSKAMPLFMCPSESAAATLPPPNRAATTS